LNTYQDLVIYIDECLDPTLYRYRRRWFVTCALCAVLTIVAVALALR
jgi:hypothetical protein